MATQKTLNTRMKQKHGKSSEWAQAKNFTPLLGEIIVYDDLHKIKIGDGNTLINNLPFIHINWNEIDSKPSSMPASDVYSWAKASTKPTYKADEIKFTDGESFQKKFNDGDLTGPQGFNLIAAEVSKIQVASYADWMSWGPNQAAKGQSYIASQEAQNKSEFRIGDIAISVGTISDKNFIPCLWFGKVTSIDSSKPLLKCQYIGWVHGEVGPKGDKGEPGKNGAAGAKGEPGKDGAAGAKGEPGKDGTSVTHSWSGSKLTVTSASGTSSADLKGPKGDPGPVIQRFEGTKKNGIKAYSVEECLACVDPTRVASVSINELLDEEPTPFSNGNVSWPLGWIVGDDSSVEWRGWTYGDKILISVPCVNGKNYIGYASVVNSTTVHPISYWIEDSTLHSATVTLSTNTVSNKDHSNGWYINADGSCSYWAKVAGYTPGRDHIICGPVDITDIELWSENLICCVEAYTPNQDWIWFKAKSKPSAPVHLNILYGGSI